jgi:hypothetical protein
LSSAADAGPRSGSRVTGGAVHPVREDAVPRTGPAMVRGSGSPSPTGDAPAVAPWQRPSCRAHRCSAVRWGSWSHRRAHHPPFAHRRGGASSRGWTAWRSSSQPT